ncbi:DNA-binding transcriptional LysR family regulator [Anoxybacillus voinovskiensis]|uniref:DNA-binding transcriptional LysR family regulator n=1 Tax=Anoxybacteroides voinovskiense TaxID=230470 RepID=A0A840DGG1_9BACL|nr:LysR family transcriptional regulator [Anoxybacillus voinovskiensis]MBB4072481.1 DNA-binding transcriptional LysR family regulator [Anoxybacillus voinovskiensis]GGJ57513.1 HTH-type transcriptional regulator CysL [Anoxybacillus voinovskiensis]
MYYEELKTFVTLAEVKNFTKTAEILHLSQPSVSLHIKNLEKEFQTKLFVRSPKRLQMTPTGEMLYDRAKQMIALYEQTKQDILEHHHSVKGTLKIGASFTIGEYILPPLLFELQNDYPELELEVVIGNTKEIVELVRSFQADIGLIEGQTNEKELSVHAFMQDELVIVASNDHELVHKAEVSIADLQNQAWVTREVGSGTREYFNHFIRSNGLKVKSLMIISSNQGIKEALIAGSALSLLSRSVVMRDIAHGHLSLLRLNYPPFHRTFSYIYSPIMANKKNVHVLLRALEKKRDES